MTFYAAHYPFTSFLGKVTLASGHPQKHLLFAQRDAARLDALLAQKAHLQSHTLAYFTQSARFLHPSYRFDLCHYAGSVLAHALFFSQSGRQAHDPLYDPSFSSAFGSIERFEEAVLEESRNIRCGGWVFLCREGRDNALRLCHTQGNDIPDLELRRPIACLDCWEHAYWESNQNDLRCYIHNWISSLNWHFLQYDATSLHPKEA